MIKNIPNLLSIFRLITIPIVAWLLLIDLFFYAALFTLGRNDLAHADNTDVDFSLGTGAEEGTLKNNEIPWKLVKKVSSQGYLRGQDGLSVVSSSGDMGAVTTLLN